MAASTRPHPEQQLTPPTDTRRPGRRRLAVAILAALAAGAVLAAAFVVLNGRDGGWDTVWTDDFDGSEGSAPSARTWITDLGTQYPGGAAAWGTGEMQSYTADRRNVALDGEGNLRITPTKDASGAWKSARLETRRDDFQPEDGGTLRAEARIRIPDGGQGYWSAFWMLGAPFRPSHTDWPGAGEIDILEHIGSEPRTVHGTFHCGVWGGGPCKETTGLGAGVEAPEPYHQDFHTYAVEWDRSTATEEIRWYVDTKLYHTVRATDVDEATWKRATDHGFFVLLNVAVGGGWPGPPDATTRPGRSMLVDHVSVLSRT